MCVFACVAKKCLTRRLPHVRIALFSVTMSWAMPWARRHICMASDFKTSFGFVPKQCPCRGLKFPLQILTPSQARLSPRLHLLFPVYIHTEIHHRLLNVVAVGVPGDCCRNFKTAVTCYWASHLFSDLRSSLQGATRKKLEVASGRSYWAFSRWVATAGVGWVLLTCSPDMRTEEPNLPTISFDYTGFCFFSSIQVVRDHTGSCKWYSRDAVSISWTRNIFWRFCKKTCIIGRLILI